MDVLKVANEVVDLCGVADFTKSPEVIEEYGEDIVKYPYAISLAIRLNPDIINRIPESVHDQKLAEIYMNEYFDSMTRLKDRASKVVESIENEGYHAILIDVSGLNENLNLKKRFSHKVTANLCGIGWIGKNALLTTKEYGPRLTWCTIITDAPLENEVTEAIEPLCGDCDCCGRICPSGAIDSTKQPPESYDSSICAKYMQEKEKKGEPTACGLCLYICPYGHKDN